MNETLEPWGEREKKLLELAGPLEPPAGAEARVFEALQTSLAALPVAAAASASTKVAATTASGLTVKAIVGVATVALGVGVGAGVGLGRTYFAAPVPEPRVIERVVRVEVPAAAAPAVERAAAPSPATNPSPSPTAAPSRPQPAREPAIPSVKAPAPDELLAKEHALIDTARSALLHRDAAAAIVALEAHAALAQSRLNEERESLWVQALVMKSALADARARAAHFHQNFPRSLLGPTVDAALNEGEKP